MATVTASEMLENVNTAINAILTGGAVQSYSVGSRRLDRMTLSELRSLRKELQAEVDAAGGRATNYAEFEGD